MGLDKKEFARFCIAGGVATIINFAVFFICIEFLKIDKLVAFSIGYFAGVLVGFILNKKFTFNSLHKSHKEPIKYFIIYSVTLFLGLSLFKYLTDFLHIGTIPNFVITITITTITNYYGAKIFAFKKITFPKIFYSRIFIFVLFLKIIFSFIFASDFLLKGTIPFINYFIDSGLSNPYDHFLEIGQLKAFPYSTTMLLTMSISTFLFYFLPNTLANNVFLQLFLSRIPLLIADIGIFYILLNILHTKEKELLILYWCSPIVFYISYFHGQLDVIPIFFLMVSVYFILTEKYLKSALMLGVALSAKANIFAAVPFILIYLWRSSQGAKKIFKYIAVSAVVYIALILPVIFSKGYQKLVLGAEEQFWILLLQLPLGANGIILYIVPLTMLIFFLRLTYFRKINQDALLMSLAGSFIIIVALVPPRPGWVLWFIPFLAYFFAKDEHISKINYFLVNFFFIIYFMIISRTSDVFYAFQAVSLHISATPNLYSFLAANGLNADFISNIIFTAFIGVIIANFYFVYKFGILANLKYRKGSLIIGLAGDSGSGKSYTGKLIEDLVGEKNLTLLEGDDLHKWERGHPNWETLTHLNPKSNSLHKEIEHITRIAESKKLKRKEYDHNTGKFREEKVVWPKKFILFSGLHTLYLSKMRNIIEVKIFLQPHPMLRRYWKIIRDTKERGYTKEKVLSMLEARKNDSEKYLEPQKKFADLVVSFQSWNKIKIDDADIKKELCIIVDNSFDPNFLAEEISKYRTMKMNFDYNDDLTTLSLTFEGKLTALEIAAIAYSLDPNLDEVLENRAPKWRNDLDGILQLVILCYISEKLKSNDGKDDQ